MPISDQHREQIFRTLTILRQGFLELGEVDGTPCVPMLKTGTVVVPEGTASLFLRIWIPPRALESGPARFTVVGEEETTLSHIEMRAEEMWASISTRGSTRIRIEAEKVWAGTLAGLPGQSDIGALIRDAEVMASDLRPRFDLEASDHRSHRFLSLRLDLTNKCNLRCRMCPLSFDEIFHQRKNYVEVADFERVARQLLPRAEQLSLSVAYEPLLHPDFGEFLAIVRSHSVPFVEFTTNGTRLDEKLMHVLVDQDVSRVTFSVDGARADTYEHIRRGADFARFKAGLETFGRVRKARGATRPELSFNMVLMRSNIDELPEVIRLGAANGLDVMHTCLLIPHVGLEMEDEALQHDRARANRALGEARRVARELGIRASFPDDFNLELPEEPVESLPSTPEYTLAEDWGKERKRSYTLTRDDEVGELDFELSERQDRDRSHRNRGLARLRRRPKRRTAPGGGR